MSDDRDFDERIDIGIIIRIFLIEKKFYVFVKLKNSLEVFIVDNLIDIKKKIFFY